MRDVRRKVPWDYLISQFEIFPFPNHRSIISDILLLGTINLIISVLLGHIRHDCSPPSVGSIFRGFGFSIISWSCEILL